MQGCFVELKHDHKQADFLNNTITEMNLINVNKVEHTEDREFQLRFVLTVRLNFM